MSYGLQHTAVCLFQMIVRQNRRSSQRRCCRPTLVACDLSATMDFPMTPFSAEGLYVSYEVCRCPMIGSSHGRGNMLTVGAVMLIQPCLGDYFMGTI